MALCATTALAGAVPRLCVRSARGRFGGFGPVPGVVSPSFPPSRRACPALRVAGRPVRVSLTLARWYAIPRGLCVPRARSGCPCGCPRVPLSCVCARAPAASAPPPVGGVACAPRVVPGLRAGRAVPRGSCPSACPAPVPCSVWRALGGGGPVPVPPYLAWGCGGGGRASPGGVPWCVRAGRPPGPDCPPSGRAAGPVVRRPGSDALQPPTARPLGGLPGGVWGVRGRALSHPRLLALWAGCRGRCGASGVGRSPTSDCPPSRRAAGAGVGRPGSDALPTPTARPLGGLPGPVWGVRGQALSHLRLPALWAGCRGRCGASGVGALPSPTARPLGGLPGPVSGVRGRTLSHPRLPALWVGCRGRCGASGVRRSPTPDCSHSGRAAGAGMGRPGSDALLPPTARPLGGLPGPVWGIRGRALSHPRLPALWAGCRGRCGASGVGRSPTPDCPPSERAAGAGVGRPGSGPLPPPTARRLGGLLGPLWGVRGRTLSHPRLPALWAGCRGRCGASGVGRSPTPDCSPSGRAAGAGVGRPGSDALHPRLPALWAGCWCWCGASGVGGAPTPDCSPSGRAAGAGVGRPGSGAPPAPTARPLGGLPGPVRGVRGRALSHPRLLALWAGCRGRCGASGVGRSPTPDCSPSGRAAGAGVGRPGSGALPPPTARPLGGLPGPVWGVRGRTISHRDCPPSGRAAGAGVGRPGSDALPTPTARPLGGLPGPVCGVWGRTLSHPRLPALGGLPGPVWGVLGRAVSHPRLLALWAGCRGWCGASGVGRSPDPDCPPSGRAAGAGVGRPGSGALPPPTARPLGGLPGPVWGVRGRTLSHPRLPVLWAGCRGWCGASGVGRSPDPDCPSSGRAAGAGVGRPGSDALLPRLPALWAGCRGRCGASGVGGSPTPDCPPSGRAAGAGVGRPGSGALPPPTARPLGGLPGPVWGVLGRTLSHSRLPALWAGCRGWCRASGVGRSPTPDCPPSGRAAGAGVGRPGLDALPPPTARPLGGLPGPVWAVRGRALSHPRLLALWAGCRGRRGASGVGRSPTPDCSPSGRAAGAGVGRLGSDALPNPTACLWAGRRGRCGASGVGRSPTPDCSPSGRAAGAGVGRPGSDALPPPTARPLGGLPGPVWGVRGRKLSHPRLTALWAGCRGRCAASGVGRSPTPDCPPSGRAAGAGVGRPGLGALPPPTARPSGGLPGCCACALSAWPGRASRPPGRVLVRLTFSWPFLLRSLLLRPRPG